LSSKILGLTGRRLCGLFALAGLALTLAGAALAQPSSGSLQVNVTILDGKIKVAPATFSPGKLTLVAVNKGKVTHALAIEGTGLKLKRTPALVSGKTAQLTVTLKVGVYRVWDPVQSSLTHATALTVKAPATTKPQGSSSTSSSSTPTPATPAASTTAPRAQTTQPTTGTNGGAGAVVCDHMEVGTDCG
jgi:hypothetical protein